LEGASYYKCKDCGYEFLAKMQNPTCPRCKSPKLENRDMKSLVAMDK
jgi:predicted Zn-ribbon and HTH transcriptional regulator